MELEKLIKNKLKSQEIPKIEYYSNLHFNDIENTSGIYSWHIIPPNNINETNEKKIELLKLFVEFFNLNDIEISGKTNFHAYEGELIETKTNSNEFNNNIEKIVSFNNENYIHFLASLAFFPSTLYVGMSTKLKDRINQHFDSLNNIHSNLNYLPKSLEDNLEDKFGNRVIQFYKSFKDGGLLRKYFSPSNFYVKIMYVDNITDSNLKNIEYYLNRTIKPKFGKL